MKKQKKSKKSDYIILALICLIILNIGAIVIGTYSAKIKDVGKEEKNSKLVFNKLIKSLDIENKINKIIGLIFTPYKSYKPKGAIVVGKNKETEYEMNETEEYYTEDDIIIENLDEYESLIIIKDSEGTESVENIPEPLMLDKMNINKEKPYILLYHTHATESYLLAKSANYRSSDAKQNMITIGNIISTVLEAKGHRVDHDKTFHDLPSYNQSYSRSLNTIRIKQESADNLKVLLDIHRDAVADSSPNIESIKSRSIIDIGGKPVATFSLVVGPDSPNKDKVLSFAKYVKAVSDAMYPGLCKGITIKPAGKYNQHLSDYSALIEVGYHINTFEEAVEGAKLVGEVLAVALNGLIE